MSSVVFEKSLEFAVRCVRFYDYLRSEKKEYVISKQILRSGTSIGANISESQGAQSTPDFVAKLHVSLKEARETAYWLLVLYKSDKISEAEYDSMNKDLDELISLLVSILKTVKAGSEFLTLNS